ncbi:MAG: NRDE family protein [Chitinophagaceae bacterium]|nr:NRDE family protein [Chitinophagaceae bacterium]
MCTVTYIPHKDGFYLTSNRDEKKIRLKAEEPKWYPFASGQIMFPKDGNAGGTWMALHENGNAMVLLNGGFINHVPALVYRKSRGLVFLDVFDHPQPVAAFEQINLHKVEPFTLVIRQQQYLFEAVWDGDEKTLTECDVLQPRIWSSATLYDADVVKRRKEWFEAFIKNNGTVNNTHILNFHHFAGDGDRSNDVLMNRNNELFTVSISQLERSGNDSAFHYFDLQSNQTAKQLFTHQPQPDFIHEAE